MSYYNIPELTKQTIDDYVKLRYQPGHFVTALLANDLFGAVGRADAENAAAFIEICKYIYNKVPLSCWGNYEKVQAWLKNDEI